MADTDYSFNGQDYDVSVRLYNGINDVYLTNTAWDDLYIEDNIFDIFMRGSIMINTPYDSFERESDETLILTNSSNKNIIYKFRNDGRDTLYISIKPKNDPLPGLEKYQIDLPDEKWLIELELVIYDVQDMAHGNPTDKRKKLLFWEKTYQMMLERDSEYTTAISGANKDKHNQDQVDDNERSLTTGDALGALLQQHDEFKKHAKFVGDAEKWHTGHPENLLYYTSPVNSKFIDDLNYLYSVHVSDDMYNKQPCLLKLERASKGQPKQFTLMPFQVYFEKAGKDASEPGEYQTEHYFIQEHSYDAENKTPTIQKAPLAKDSSTEIKADEYTVVKQYQIVDLVGGDYYKNLANRRLASYNATNGQFNLEAVEHKAEEWKTFYEKSVATSILTNATVDRLPLTPYIRDGHNTTVDFTMLPNTIGRLALGRNKIIQYYIFSNLGICFSTRGLTMRQPGRFFGLSKNTLNDKEFDHKLEGQYLTTNVIHHFSNTDRTYYTQMVGVKTHVYDDQTPFSGDDIILIGDSGGSTPTPSGTKPVQSEDPAPIIPTSPPLPITGDVFDNPNPPIDEIATDGLNYNPSYPLFPPFSE